MTIAIQKTPHSDWGKILIPFKEKQYTFHFYVPSREIFNFDPDPLIRFKCLVLAMKTPVVSVMRSVYWLAKSVLEAISEAFRYLDDESATQKTKPVSTFKVTAYDSIRALGYGAAMTGCAFAGIVAPYWARLNYGRLERDLNRHADGPHRDKFYLAYCFQRLAIMPKDGILNAEVINKLTKCVARVDSIKSALLACACNQLMVELRIFPPEAA